MISRLRKYAYLISALAIACFFLVPDPYIALIGAVLLQTLAYIVIAGKSTADGIVLSGITIFLIGCLPADHPMIRGPYFESIHLWVIATGVILLATGLLMLLKENKR